MLLKDKTAVITGAGRGIGRETALRFAAQGAAVLLAARTASDLDSLVKEITAQGGKAVAHVADVTQEREVQGMIDRAIGELGRIDILVNNVGSSLGYYVELVDLDMAKWDAVHAVTLRSTAMCCKYALKHMIPRRSGNIINIASRAGRLGQARQSAYCSAKFAVRGLTQVLADEVGPYSIRVNCVLPGATLTENLKQWFHVAAKAKGITHEEAMATYLGQTRLKRIPLPQETAEVILFMASDLSSGIHGQGIDVNAGSFMS